MHHFAQQGTAPLYRKLQAMQLRIGAAAREQLGVRALLHQPARIEHYNQIGLFNGRQAMRNDERGSALHQFTERILDDAFRFAIER